MADIISLSIIHKHDKIIASTILEYSNKDTYLSKIAYNAFATAKELLDETRKGAYYQLAVRDQEGIVFITEINASVILLTATNRHVKYALMAMDLKRIANDIANQYAL